MALGIGSGLLIIDVSEYSGVNFQIKPLEEHCPEIQCASSILKSYSLVADQAIHENIAHLLQA
jgi:hypothetical protein